MVSGDPRRSAGSGYLQPLGVAGDVPRDAAQRQPVTVHGTPRAGALRRARLRRHLARHGQQQPQGQGELPPAAHHHRPLPPGRGPPASAPGRRGARRPPPLLPPPPRRGERSGNFQGAEKTDKAESSLSKAKPRKQARQSAMGGSDPLLKATWLGGGRSGALPRWPVGWRGEARRRSELLFTRSRRRRSKATGWGYGGLGLAPSRPLQSRDSPPSLRLEAAEPGRRKGRAPCAPLGSHACPSTAPRGAAAGLTRRTHRLARGASANHTPLAGIHQTVSRKEEGGKKKVKHTR